MSFQLSSLRQALALLSCIAMLLVAVPNLVVQNPSAQSCQSDCSGLPGIPPVSPSPRSYDEFIDLAYQGAYGRQGSCAERRLEYNKLLNAAANGTLLIEARRFVATLFMTQASYDAQDLTTYLQTAEYQQRNPQDHADRASIESFVADLYRAFLQREPDLAGQCFWSNDVCVEGRKKGIRAFEVCSEFGDLVNGLFAGVRPSTICPRNSFLDPVSCTCESL
jgi:uncharacterized protein DUF4214